MNLLLLSLVMFASGAIAIRVRRKNSGEEGWKEELALRVQTGESSSSAIVKTEDAPAHIRSRILRGQRPEELKLGDPLLDLAIGTREASRKDAAEAVPPFFELRASLQQILVEVRELKRALTFRSILMSLILSAISPLLSQIAVKIMSGKASAGLSLSLMLLIAYSQSAVEYSSPGQRLSVLLFLLGTFFLSIYLTDSLA